MSEGFLQLKIDGPRGTIAKAQILANLDKVRTDWAEDTFRAFGEYIRRVVVKRQFETEGSYLGGGWDQLSPRYLEWKIRGGWMTDIGKRAGVMVQALTQAAEPFSRRGPRGQLRGAPILDAGPSHVTIGAAVTEDGNEYSEHFDRRRPIMGEGKLPAQVQIEGGKVLSFPYLIACRTEEFGGPQIDRQFPDAAITKYISARALVQAAP